METRKNDTVSRLEKPVVPSAEGLRKQAEEKAVQSPNETESLSPAATRLTLHELHVHQIELEMKNEELRRMQVELDVARARYFDLYDLAPVGYITVSEQGMILESNLTFSTLLGVTRSTLVNCPFSRFIPKEDVNSYDLFHEKLFATDTPQAFELRLVKSDGSPFWAHLTATAAQDAEGNPLSRIVLSDINERKHAENMLRMALQAAGAGTWEWDMTTDRLCWSSEMFRLFGLDPAMATASFETWRNIIHPDDLSDAEEHIRAAIRDHVRLTNNYRILLQTGEVRWIHAVGDTIADASHKTQRMLGICIDITERMQTETYRDMSLQVLQILNGSDSLREAIGRVLAFVKTQTGADAVGLRLQDGENFPYFAHQGFPEDFLLTENSLAERGPDGGVCRDETGKVCLECTCGLVLSGKTDPTNPLFTQGGSCWTNDSAPLLDLPPAQDPRHHPRNECIHHGYASVALIPVRDKERIIGLLHLNACRKNCFTLATVKILEDLAAHIGEALVNKRAEDGLRASEAKFRALLENLQVGVVVHAPDTSILISNPMASELLGLTSEQMQGKTAIDPAWRFVREDGTKLPLSEYPVSQALGAGIPASGLIVGIVRPDRQSPTLVECFSRKIWSPAGDLDQVIITFSDITVRRNAEAAARESAQIIEGIINALPVRVFWKDKQLAYLGCNVNFARDAGFSSPQDILGKDDFQMGWRAQAEAYRADDRAVIETGRAKLLIEEFQTSPTGETLTLLTSKLPLRDLQGEICGVLGAYMDITAHKQAEDALQALSSRQEAILSAIPDIIMEVDCNKVYRWANQPGFAFFGEDVIGKEAAFYFASDDPVYSTVQPLFDGDENVIRVTSWQRRKDGEKRLLDWSCRVLKDPQGHVTGALSTAHDITERKRIEAELQKLDKLQSVGTLAGGIAHDFNNILTGLFGNISLAKEDLSITHPSYAFLDEAGKSMNRAVRLTKQLLTFAKGGDPVKEHITLGNIVAEVARFDLTGSNVSLGFHYDENLWPVDADRGQIQQVVSNLVINARQAMPSGGHLRIALENADLPATAVPGLRSGRYVKVIVRDQGCGIEPKFLSQIFDPYFTTKQSGHGLGLATVWSIIKKHGGHIGVVSEVGKGSTFTFYLPASAASQPAEAKPPAVERPTPVRTAKILVMDDEKTVCEIASKMLARYGYTVATAPDAQQTLALYGQALEAGAPFDLVIMDLTIPGGPGGKEVIQDLLALDPNVRAIVSSGYADDPVMANPAKYGFKGTAAKPYTSTALREAVARILV